MPFALAVLVTSFVALAALILVLLELVWPTRRRGAAGRRQRAEPTTAGPVAVAWSEAATAGNGHAVAGRPARPRAVTATIAGAPRIVGDWPRVPRREPPPPPPRPAPATALPPPGVDRRLPDPAADPPSARVDVSALRTCRDLYRRERYADTVATALALVAKQPPSRPDVTAALWSFAGLARQALGDLEGAREAFETAIATAPEYNHAPHRRHLTALALAAARAAAARADAAAEPEARARERRVAVTWARRGLQTSSRDTALRDILHDSRVELGAAWEAAGSALIERGDLTAARRVLNEALGDPDVLAGRREALRELLARATPK